MRLRKGERYDDQTAAVITAVQRWWNTTNSCDNELMAAVYTSADVESAAREFGHAAFAHDGVLKWPITNAKPTPCSFGHGHGTPDNDIRIVFFTETKSVAVVRKLADGFDIRELPVSVIVN
ncbi:hypothetical protein BH11PLA2_BH11PLA2_51650 [soil metagenome]